MHSVSKTYALTGARVGWLMTPPGLVGAVGKIQEATTSCVNTPAQRAALAALTGPQDAVAEAGVLYRERLARATAILDERGIRYLPPSGAFYLWVDVAHASRGDVAGWSERFLALAERLPELTAAEVQELNIVAKAGVLASVATPKGLF